MDRMPCGLEDDRVRFEPEDEEVEILTPVEKRLEWICSEWQLAHESDTYENWHDIRMMLHGASMGLNYCTDRYEDKKAISLLGNVAFEYSIDCIRRLKYEGAPK